MQKRVDGCISFVYNLEFDSQNDKNALGIGSLVVFLVEKVRTIFVFSFVLKCFSFFFEE